MGDLRGIPDYDMHSLSSRKNHFPIAEMSKIERIVRSLEEIWRIIFNLDGCNQELIA